MSINIRKKKVCIYKHYNIMGYDVENNKYKDYNPVWKQIVQSMRKAL